MATLSFSTYDRLGKPTSMSIGADDAVSGANVQALADAIDAVIRGSAVKAVVSVDTIVDAGNATPPNDQEANRGSKWLYRVQVAAEGGKIYTHEIGTADGSQLATASDDFLDLTAGVGLALKSAFEAVYESPNGNAGVLLSVQQVNRGLN